MPNPHPINYIELPATDLAAMKAFYGAAFGWSFEDWGPAYVAFHGAKVDGGFDGAATDLPQSPRQPGRHGALVILFSDDLAASEQAVCAAGGTISVPAYPFPGGRRFHFIDPSGNELAIWALPQDSAP